MKITYTVDDNKESYKYEAMQRAIQNEDNLRYMYETMVRWKNKEMTDSEYLHFINDTLIEFAQGRE